MKHLLVSGLIVGSLISAPREVTRCSTCSKPKDQSYSIVSQNLIKIFTNILKASQNSNNKEAQLNAIADALNNASQILELAFKHSDIIDVQEYENIMRALQLELRDPELIELVSREIGKRNFLFAAAKHAL